MRRGRRRAAVAVMVAVAAAGTVAPGWASAGGETHRAAVVVDTGDEVKTARIAFEGDSVSGVEALQLAGFDPVVRSYGGQGGAVCSVCGRGCAADSTCLTCGGADYWAYFRAVGGAASYSYSPVGAGATRVHDGDVEAWKWGPGVPPPFVSFAEVWGETATTSPPTPTTAPPTSRPTTATTQAGAGVQGSTASTGGPASTTLPGEGGSVGTAGSGSPGGETAGAGGEPVPGAGGGGDAGEPAVAGDDRDRGKDPGSGAPTTAVGRTQGRVSTTTANEGARVVGAGPVPGATTVGDGGSAGDVAVAPVAPAVDAGGGGSAVGLAAFGAVVVGLGAWIARARATRRRTAPT